MAFGSLATALAAAAFDQWILWRFAFARADSAQLGCRLGGEVKSNQSTAPVRHAMPCHVREGGGCTRPVAARGCG